mgnify:FL=1
MENEKIIWQGNSSLISNFGSFMIGIILTLTVVGAIVGIPYIIWTYLVIKNKKYELTQERLILRSGVLNKKIEELELFRIRDYSIEKPFIYNIFGVGNIILTSSDKTNPYIKLEALKEIEDLKKKIRNAVQITRKNNGVKDLEID